MRTRIKHCQPLPCPKKGVCEGFEGQNRAVFFGFGEEGKGRERPHTGIEPDCQTRTALFTPVESYGHVWFCVRAIAPYILISLG